MRVLTVQVRVQVLSSQVRVHCFQVQVQVLEICTSTSTKYYNSVHPDHNPGVGHFILMVTIIGDQLL